MTDTADAPDNVDPARPLTASQAAGLTLGAARRIVDAVVDAARSMRVPMSVAVVDGGDVLVAFQRMDGAELVTEQLARDKAYSALVNRMPTGDLAAYAEPGGEFYGYESLSGGRMVVFAGGLPLERSGVLVGAVGVSGGDASQDAAAAEAGSAAFSKL
jgi:uncharacterized protein GlcG (DUF336 family)